MRIPRAGRLSPPLRLFALAFAGLSLAGCGDIGLGTGTGGTSGSGASGGTPTTSAGSATGTGSTGGTGCTTDPQTGVTLCEQVAVCPGVDVDPGAFAGCGFRLHAAAKLDLECLCDGEFLCPIGVPTTCTDALQLLGQQASVLNVCQDVGQCLDLAVEGGAPSTTSSSCDRACESQCQSDPGCVALCGC